MTQHIEVESPGSVDASGPHSSTEGQEPRSPSERYMASLWAEILGLEEEILLPQTFISVGGNSLTLNIILNRIEAEKEVAFDAGLFFEPSRSSLFEISRELDRLLEGGGSGAEE